MADKEYVPGENRMEAIGSTGDHISFYLLTRKMVDNAKSIPEDVQDVLYYTLAIGHHTGVMDFFEERFSIPVESYRKIVDLMEDEQARRKWLGVFKFGEIEVGKEHLSQVLPAARSALSHIDVFNEVGKKSISLTADEIDELSRLVELLLRVRSETNVYLMVRRTQ